MMSERWKAVPGYEGMYEVSDLGRVRSLRNNKGLLTLLHGPGGYRIVGLSVNGKPIKVYVHALVLEAFVGPRPRGGVTRHFPDRDRTNNKLINLSWGTHADNQKDRDIHGTDQRGSKNKGAKLNEDQVVYLRGIEHWSRGLASSLARRFGVTPAVISDIKHKKRWTHV
jgi:hypothetical protein